MSTMSDCSENSEENKMLHKEEACSLWQRIHLDIACPYLGTYLLLVVDAFCKWSEIFSVNHITISLTLSVLREISGRFGLPMVMVSGIGPAF